LKSLNLSRHFFSLLLLCILLIFFILNPEDLATGSKLSALAWKTLGVAILMSVLWATELIPIPITSLLPLLLFPLFQLQTFMEVSVFYSNPLVFLYGGGFLLAIAVEKWNLHKRIALAVLRTIGTTPDRILLGFLISTASISMWASNTATTLLILPIATSVIVLLSKQWKKSKDKIHFTKRTLLSIAYAASIGGMGTVIGSPPNALLAGFVEQTLKIEFGFWQWMKYAFPIVVLLIGVLYFLFTKLVYPIKDQTTQNSEFLDLEWKSLGKMSFEEKTVAFVFSCTALLWIFLPLLKKNLPFLSDSGIAIIGAFVLFCIPASKERILVWKDAKQLPWDIILLFGGGLSLANAIEKSGLADWLGSLFLAFQGLPLILTMVLVSLIIISFTNLASNLATIATFLPILSSVSRGLNIDPLYLFLPSALMASSAFLLPVGTPPNAIIYSSGSIKIKDMFKAGLLLSISSVVIINLWFYFLIDSR
jgi:solute carrier family 13 (sodium-dependent dicarboxylate transporter), member 2/3/5